MAGIREKSLKEQAELSECGKRMYDIINQALVDFDPWELNNMWMAFKLEDGSSDKAIYENIVLAKQHTDEWTHCYYAFKIALGGISARDCEIFLDFHRQARSVNAKQRDPNAQAIMSFTGGDIFKAHQRGEVQDS
jgi:hypothetical protein